jgi:hypothetical protein
MRVDPVSSHNATCDWNVAALDTTPLCYRS